MEEQTNMVNRYRALLVSLLALCWTLFTASDLAASDWPRFRGVNGSGVSRDAASTPVEWSESKNLRWSVPLPGPGKSSPIVVGDRVIVTSWSGENPPEDLQRHLSCYDRRTGDELWSKTLPPRVEDEAFRGMFTENGYASHTPACDGERIYAFFGLSGVTAFDMDGNEVWHRSVGEGTDPNGWGTASSPILYKDLVIVPAASESAALVALDKKTGDVRWREEAEGLRGTWGTPILVETADGQQDLVIAIPGEVWGLNPDTGKLRWYVAGSAGRTLCASAIANDGVAYVLGGRDSSSLAVKVGGKNDVTDSHVQWTSSQQGGIGTPVYADGLIYGVYGGVAVCLDAETGKRVYQERLDAPPAPAAPEEKPVEGFGKPGEYAEPPRSGRGGGIRGADYSSPIIADGKLYFVRRGGDMYVLATGREFKQLAANRFASDDGDFSATPAASDGELFIRSSNKLYCVAEEQ
jgi:outer membrane protein assembly factor BamB